MDNNLNAWETCSLDNVVTKMANGANVKQYDDKVGHPISRIETIWNHFIDLGRVKYIHETDDEFVDKYRLKSGDILFSHINSDSHLGKTALFSKQVETLIHGVNLLLIRSSSQVCSSFLNYQFNYLRVSGRFIDIAQRSVNQSSINQAKLKKIIVLIPPLNEQYHIVAKIEELFSELDKGIESLKTTREQLKVYRQALLKHAFEGKLTEQWRKDNAVKLESANDLLARIQQEREARYQQQLDDWKGAVKQWEDKGKEGRKPKKPSIFKPMPEISKDEIAILPKITSTWKYFRLAEIAKIGSGMSVSKSRKLEKPVEVAYLRVANVQRGKLVLDEVKTMNIESEKLNDLKLKKYDVLFNEGGDRDKLGRGWIWESQVEPCITQNHVFRASPYLGGEFHSKFVSHWGNSFGRDYFEKGGKQTTNLASINKTVLSMFPIPITSLREQEKIIDIIDSRMSTIDAFEKDIEDTLLKSEALRQSILKKAFSGQLVPQDPNDEPASHLLKRIAEQKQAILAQEKAFKKINEKVKRNTVRSPNE